MRCLPPTLLLLSSLAQLSGRGNADDAQSATHTLPITLGKPNEVTKSPENIQTVTEVQLNSTVYIKEVSVVAASDPSMASNGNAETVTSEKAPTISITNTNKSYEETTTDRSIVITPENVVPVTTENMVITTRRIGSTTESEFIDILASFDNEEEARTSTTISTTASFGPTVEVATNKTRKERLSDQIRAVISHYKKFGKVTVPDASIPDPMSIPNMKKSFSGMDMTFTNQKVYGLSNFTIEHINTDLDKMQVYVAIYMKRMIILGNYSANVWFRKVAGPFNVTLLYVEASGAAALVRDAEGNLQASESEMDMTFIDSKVKFGNMGIMGSLLQGVAASVGPILFEAVKPVILQEINNKVREDINKKIKMIGSKFLETGTTPPLEMAIQEARNYVKENGYDPYQIDNYVINYTPTNQSMFKVNISHLVLTGLSNFRRIGEVSLSMDSGTVQMGLHLATSKLKGQCKWSFMIGKSFQRIGHTNFTVDYVQGRGIINQSLDVSQHPTLEDIDVNVGKVRIQMRGTGPFDILLEAVVNTLPDLIRHIIVDAIELPLKYAVQHILSEINVEEVLEKQLPELDKMGL